MSARIIPSSDVRVIIDALHAAAELYLRDAVKARAQDGSHALVHEALIKQYDATRVANILERSGVMPLFLRKQAD